MTGTTPRSTIRGEYLETALRRCAPPQLPRRHLLTSENLLVLTLGADVPEQTKMTRITKVQSNQGEGQKK